jgi:hypothetical protein
MGNLELALEDLTIAFRLNPEEYRQLATTDSDLDSLRSDPSFIALLESIRLVESTSIDRSTQKYPRAIEKTVAQCSAAPHERPLQ